MRSIGSLLDDFSQNTQLPIRIVSPGFGRLSPEIAEQYGLTHRLPYYFFLFMLDGSTRRGIDLQDFNIGKDELLFSLPHQIQQLSASAHGNDYYKLGFNDRCLSRLPKQYPFLLNPLNQQKICFSHVQRLSGLKLCLKYF